jgi:hypothetical protein
MAKNKNTLVLSGEETGAKLTAPLNIWTALVASSAVAMVTKAKPRLRSVILS